jgi:hypothetical protein
MGLAIDINTKSSTKLSGTPKICQQRKKNQSNRQEIGDKIDRKQ